METKTTDGNMMISGFSPEQPTKDRVKSLWLKAKAAASKTTSWVKDHPYETIGLATAGAAIIKETTKLGSKIAQHCEDKDRENRIWDPSLGDWWELRRQLKPIEKLELEKRLARGETRGEILRSMGLLRK